MNWFGRRTTVRLLGAVFLRHGNPTQRGSLWFPQGETWPSWSHDLLKSGRPEKGNVADEPCDSRYDARRVRNPRGRGRVHIMPVLLQTTLLLICSNVFMTFAWYAHLKDLSGRPWFIAALVSWGVALAEYLLQVPANRIGYSALSLGQLKILQEVIALAVFVPFAVLYMKQPLKLNYLWAALCICAAVYFVFRES